jgi:transcriptional regulator with XRE-family HTH domain
MDIVKKFGLKVKKVRLSKHMSQGDLAKKLGVGPSYISQIERGLQNVSLKVIEKIAKALGISITEIFNS